MPEVSATDAARNFSDMLDAVEHHGEWFTIVRRGKVVALLNPVSRGKGRDVKSLLAQHPIDPGFAGDLASVRELLEIEDRS
jgi:antitoxin (DNA-binding transcriptional repressor) of toxin-antitoxin stability system